MAKKRWKRRKEPTVAPTFDGDEVETSASKEEIARGEYTEVTTLSFDEVDPSEGEE